MSNSFNKAEHEKRMRAILNPTKVAPRKPLLAFLRSGKNQTGVKPPLKTPEI